MEPTEILSESLTKLTESLQSLDKDCDTEFQGVGSAIVEIHAAADSTYETFIKNIVKLSQAIIDTRSKSDALCDLPILPYDLWLPFKTESSKPSPTESMSKAPAIFNKHVSEMASRWRPIASRLQSRSEPARFDQELLTLGETLLNHYSFCNSFCSTMPGWGRRLFAPEEKESTELFGRVLRLPVRSESEFKSFTLSVYKVFDESLPNEVRQWKKHKEQLPPLLLEIAENILDVEGGFFGDFTVLRNKLAAHGKRDEDEENSSAAELSPIYQKLTGWRTIAPNDSEKWVHLQKAVLQNLGNMFDEMRRMFDSNQTVPRPD